MRAYCESGRCRRQALLRYFDETDTEACGRCDACRRSATPGAELEDLAPDVRLLLTATIECGGRLGVSTVLATLRGAPPAKYPWLATLPSCGTGASRPLVHWKCVENEAHMAGLVEYVSLVSGGGHGYTSLAISATGRAWLDLPESTLLCPSTEESGASKRTRNKVSACGDDTQDSSDGLFDRLARVRQRLANEARLPPYMVCSNATLRDLCRLRPRTKSDLLAVNGIGPLKAKKYGSALLHCLEEHEVDVDSSADRAASSEPYG